MIPLFSCSTGEYGTPLNHRQFPIAETAQQTYTPGIGQFYGYIRTSRALQEGVPGMDPGSQELQLRRTSVPLGNIFRDGGDTLVAGAIDRIGRTPSGPSSSSGTGASTFVP